MDSIISFFDLFPIFGEVIYLRSLSNKDFANNLVLKTANFHRAEVIVNSPFYMATYRVGPYQLIGSWLFAVPQDGKTGPALYF